MALAGVYAVSKAWLQDAGKELLAPLAAERAGEAAAVGGVGGIREGEDAGGGGRGRGRRAGGGGGRRKGSDGAGGGGGGLGEEEVEAALLGWGRGEMWC